MVRKPSKRTDALLVCFVLHDICLAFDVVMLWKLCLIGLIVSMEETSIHHVFELIRNVAVARVLFRNRAGARGIVW